MQRLCRATVASPVAFTDFRNWNEPVGRMKVGEREERSFLPCFFHSPRNICIRSVRILSFVSEKSCYRVKTSVGKGEF